MSKLIEHAFPTRWELVHMNLNETPASEYWKCIDHYEIVDEVGTRMARVSRESPQCIHHARAVAMLPEIMWTLEDAEKAIRGTNDAGQERELVQHVLERMESIKQRLEHGEHD